MSIPLYPIHFLRPMFEDYPADFEGAKAWYIKDEDYIAIFTHTGGKNRHRCEVQNVKLRKMKDYVEDYDDPENDGYAYFILKVPDKYKEDYKKYVEGRWDFSEEYKKVLPPFMLGFPLFGGAMSEGRTIFRERAD